MSRPDTRSPITVALTYRPATVDHDQIDEVCLQAPAAGYRAVLPLVEHNETVRLLGVVDTDDLDRAVTVAIAAIGDQLGDPVAAEALTNDEFEQQNR